MVEWPYHLVPDKMTFMLKKKKRAIRDGEGDPSMVKPQIHQDGTMLTTDSSSNSLTRCHASCVCFLLHCWLQEEMTMGVQGSL